MTAPVTPVTLAADELALQTYYTQMQNALSSATDPREIAWLNKTIADIAAAAAALNISP